MIKAKPQLKVTDESLDEVIERVSLNAEMGAVGELLEHETGLARRNVAHWVGRRPEPDYCPASTILPLPVD